MIGKHGVEVDLEVRSNTRVMWDDPDEAVALLSVAEAQRESLVIG